jgi:phage terminase small subunit
MGKIIDIAAEIQRDNPHARLIDVHVFADALRIYHEASENVAANGAICSHPRTGAPIENPYLKIQAQQGIILGRMKTIKSDRVMDLLEKSGGA